MSSLTQEKVSDDILRIERNNEVIANINKDKPKYDPISTEKQEEVIARKNAIVTDEVCIKAKLAYPTMKEMKVDTVKTYVEAVDKNGYELPIDMNKIEAFQSLKCKWLYFRLNKVEMTYETDTQLGNRTPIKYQYVPPSYYMVKYGPFQDRNYVTSFKGGKDTLSNPLYIVRNAFHGRIDINSQYYNEIVKKNTVVSSSLQDNLFISNFNYDITYLDYGSFMFSSDVKQNITVKVHYYFSFYTFGDPETQYGIEEHQPIAPFDPNNPL